MAKSLAVLANAQDNRSLPAQIKTLPKELYIEVSNRCNSKCETCPLTFGPQEAQKNLAWGDFLKLVAAFPVLERVVLHGIGEPLLNHNLPQMIRYLKAERGSHVLFNTNAVLLRGHWNTDLIASGLDELRVSMDGATPETYLKTRGVPAFERVLSNVREFIRVQGELGAQRPRVSFFFTGSQENLAELPLLLEIADEIGVREVYLQRLVYFEQGLATQEASIYQPADEAKRNWVEDIISRCEQRSQELGITFRGSGAVGPRQSVLGQGESMERPAAPWQGCTRPWRLTYVTANGTALPCCIAPFTGVPYDGIVLGNVLSEGVEAVWNGEKYRTFRERLASDDNPPASCAGCGSWWSL